MNNYLNNRYRMMKKVDEVCEEYKNDLYLIQNFQGEHTKLKNNNLLIENTVQSQTWNTKPTTESTKQVKIKLSNLLYRLQKKCRSYARNIKDINLVERLSYPRKYIEKARKADVLTRSREIQKTITDNLALFVSITNQDQADMNYWILQFETVSQKTGLEQSEKKGMGSDLLPAEFEEGQMIVDNLYDMAFGEYEETKPELVNVIEAAMVIYDLGTNITRVIFTINEKGKPTKFLKDVEVLLYELNRTAISNHLGKAVFEKMRARMYKFIFTLTGYVTLEMYVQVKKGKTIEVTVEMEKA